MTTLTRRMLDMAGPRSIIACLLVSMVLTGCAALTIMDSSASPSSPMESSAESASARACPVTEPMWIKPPEDSAVEGSPDYGYYYVNEDRSIWASAWWTGEEETYLRASEEGVKVGWFRPAGAVLAITGHRIDGQAPALHAHVPCCYPTRFQATGLFFPTEGCWEINAKAADSKLSFILKVEP